MSFVPVDRVWWWGRRDSILLYLVIYRGGRRGWVCNILRGLTLCLCAIGLQGQLWVRRGYVICVEERTRVLRHVVSVGGNMYGENFRCMGMLTWVALVI